MIKECNKMEVDLQIHGIFRERMPINKSISQQMMP